LFSSQYQNAFLDMSIATRCGGDFADGERLGLPSDASAFAAS